MTITKNRLLTLAVVIILSVGAYAQFPWQPGFWGRDGFSDRVGEEPIIDIEEYSDMLLSRLSEIAQDFGTRHKDISFDFGRRVDFIHYISQRVDFLADTYSQNLIPMMLLDPPIENPQVVNVLNSIISLLQVLYAVAIILIALYLMFIAASPKRRVLAKSTLIRLIFGIGIIMLTLPLILLLMQISHGISSLILKIVDPDPGIFKIAIGFFFGYFTIIAFFEPALGVPFLLVSVLLPAAVLAVLSIRYLMVIILTAVFPFTVLLYSFYPTYSLGRRLVGLTILWIFFPVIEVAILSVIWIGANVSPMPEMDVFIIIAGFILLIMGPLIMYLIMRFIANMATTVVTTTRTRR